MTSFTTRTVYVGQITGKPIQILVPRPNTANLNDLEDELAHNLGPNPDGSLAQGIVRIGI